MAGDKGYKSFEEAFSAGCTNKVFCAVCIATTAGLNQIQQQCAGVTVCAGNTMTPGYSAFASPSLIWPEELATAGPEFIQRISEQIGIPDNDGGEGDWRGFEKQGLAIAFEHAVPDSTLPIFHFEENGWVPLVRKR